MDEEEYVMVNGRKTYKRQMWGRNNQELQNGISMQMHSSYGCSQLITIGNCFLAEEELLIYVCGKHIVKYDIGKKKQTFIQKLPDEEEVVTLSSCMNAKQVLSVAVGLSSYGQGTSKQYALVRVYKSNKKVPYSLVHQHLSLGVNLKQIHMIQNAKYLVSLTEYNQLYYISIFKSNQERLCTFVEITDSLIMIFGQVNFHTNFGVLGKRYLKMWEYNEDEKVFDQIDQQFQYLNDEEEFIYAASLNKNDSFAAITNYGDMLVFRKKVMVQRITIELPMRDVQEAFGNITSQKNPQKLEINNQKIQYEYFPCLLASFSGGMIVGFQGVNLISVYDQQKEGKLLFKKTHRVNVQNYHRMVFLHVGNEDSYICMAVQHQQKQMNNLYDKQASLEETKVNKTKQQGKRTKYVLDPVKNNIEIYLFNFGIVDVINTALRDPFEYLFPNGVHKGRILDVELSPTKSLIVTLSEDKLVKVWEFGYTRGDFKCIYSIVLHESPACVALHPLAFQCAIGYREGLKYYFVLEDELKQVTYENLRLCTAVKYSNGGNYLAVGSYTLINVYSPFSYQLLYTLTGHTGQITQIRWEDNDEILTSSCTQGLVFCFNINTGQRTFEHSFKAYKSLCTFYDNEYDFLIGSFTDQKVRLFNERGTNVYYEMDVYPSTYTCITIVKHMEVLFFGTAAGTIRVYLWPFTDFSVKQQEFSEIALHQGAVLQVRITPDLNFMISGSEDGTIFITKIHGIRDGQQIEVKDLLSQDLGRVTFSLANLYSLNQLVFVSKSNQDNKRDLLKEIEFRIANLKSDEDDEKERIKSYYNGIIKGIDDNNKQQIAKQKEFLSTIMEESDTRQKTLEMNLEDIRNQHKVILTVLEQETSASLLTQYQKYDLLKENYKDIQKNNIIDIEKAKNEHKYIEIQVDNDFNKKFGELYGRYQQAQNNLKLDEKKFKEVFAQSEKEFESMLGQTKKKLIQELDEQNTRSEELRSSNTKISKEIEKFNLRKIELEGILKETQSQIEHLEAEKRKFEGKNMEMQLQLNEKEDSINKKEQEIKNLRNKNHHLQNFRIVFDYKLNTLIDEKQPLSDHLGQLDGNVKNMYKELIDESEANKKINENILDTQKKIFHMKQMYRQKRETLIHSKCQIIQLQYDILQKLKEPEIKFFPQMFSQLHEYHFRDDQKRSFNQFATIGNQTVNYQDNDEYLLEMERNSQEAIKSELLRQRDFLSKKIGTISRLNKQSEQDRDDLILRVQSENTTLIKECNTLREERKGLKEHQSNIQKAFDILNNELKHHDLRIDPNQSIMLEESVSDEGIKNILLQPHNFATNQKKQTMTASTKSLKPTGFQRYHQEKDEKILKQQFSQSLPRFKPSITQRQHNAIENQALLINLLREIQQFNIDGGNNNDQVVNKLKEQVQSFIKSEESQIILPNLQRVNQSQVNEETTQLIMGELSGANTSMESKLRLNNSITKKNLGKVNTLPNINQKL